MPFCYHLVAGIRHLLSDIHIGDTLKRWQIDGHIDVFVVSIIISYFGRDLVMVKSVLSVNHQGLRDWIIQRVSAIVMAVYFIGLDCLSCL